MEILTHDKLMIDVKRTPGVPVCGKFLFKFSLCNIQESGQKVPIKEQKLSMTNLPRYIFTS